MALLPCLKKKGFRIVCYCFLVPARWIETKTIKRFFRGFITNNLKIIAHNFALNGFASFRYDKRRKSKTDRDLKKIGFKNLLNDAEKAIDFLLSIDEFDSNKVFVVGHSEGGVIGTILASENKSIKGLISITSPVSPFDKIFIDQIEHILKVKKKSKEKVEIIIKALTETFNLMRERIQKHPLDLSKKRT